MVLSKFKKILSFLRKYWYIVVIVFITVMSVFLGLLLKSDKNKIIRLLQETSELYLQKVDKLENLQEIKEQEQKTNLENFLESTKLLEEEHGSVVFDIEEERKKREDSLTKKSSKELSDKLKDEFDL